MQYLLFINNKQSTTDVQYFNMQYLLFINNKQSTTDVQYAYVLSETIIKVY